MMLALLSPFIACKSVPPPPPPQASIDATVQEGVPGGVMVETINISARVTAIDKTNRNVTLLGPDGDTSTVNVGPEAVNFDQINVGDLVNVTVAKELVVYLKEKGESMEDGSAALVAQAEKGEQPGGLVAGIIQITGTVTAIDLGKHTATLQFEDGSTKTFPVRYDVDLSNHEVGEQVVFRVSKMIAIRVDKP
jgi:hypothetical protein